jgi:threonylcarbamoyladenosine tRNA methylthiotransferase MtaB
MISRRTVAFHTFGCKVNQYESEELRTQLAMGGFEIVSFESRADVFVINSCSVTADADSSCRQLVRKIVREHPESRVVVTGCYAERAPAELQAVSPKIEIFGNKDKPMIAMALGVPTSCVQAAAKSGVVGLADRSRAYIKVQDGCDAHCTYCIIPSVRPELTCRAPALVLREARALLERGFREIVLTGVRLGRYVYQASENDCWDLVRLVENLLALEGDFRIRLSSIEVTEIPDTLIEMAATHPKLCPHFHIPLQSGDDEMLKRMGRWYTSQAYRERVRFIKSRVPEVALSADVIVGFAGEEEKHFGNTAALLEEEGFSRVHAFRFSIRPGTPAERLTNQVDPKTRAERTRRMVSLDHELRRRFAGRFLGKPLKVLQETGGCGYTERYVRVRSLQAQREGTFQMIQPHTLTSEAVLVGA